MQTNLLTFLLETKRYTEILEMKMTSATNKRPVSINGITWYIKIAAVRLHVVREVNGWARKQETNEHPLPVKIRCSFPETDRQAGDCVHTFCKRVFCDLATSLVQVIIYCRYRSLVAELITLLISHCTVRSYFYLHFIK